MSARPRGIPVTLTAHAWSAAFNRIRGTHPARTHRRLRLAHRHGIARRNGSYTVWIDPADAEVVLDVVEWLGGWFPQKHTSPAEERALIAQLRRAARNLTVPPQIHEAIFVLAELAA